MDIHGALQAWIGWLGIPAMVVVGVFAYIAGRAAKLIAAIVGVCVVSAFTFGGIGVIVGMGQFLLTGFDNLLHMHL
jgi:hypothetical protein